MKNKYRNTLVNNLRFAENDLGCTTVNEIERAVFVDYESPQLKSYKYFASSQGHVATSGITMKSKLSHIVSLSKTLNIENKIKSTTVHWCTSHG